MNTSNIILGIDPGSRKTGYGVIRKVGNRSKHIENGTFYLEREGPYPSRLKFLYQNLTDIIKKFQVQTLVVEDIFYHKNPKTIQKLSEVRGVVLLCGANLDLVIQEYTPLQIKQTVTGYGHPGQQTNHMILREICCFRD